MGLTEHNLPPHDPEVQDPQASHGAVDERIGGTTREGRVLVPGGSAASASTQAEELIEGVFGFGEPETLTYRNSHTTAESFASILSQANWGTVIDEAARMGEADARLIVKLAHNSIIQAVAAVHRQCHDNSLTQYAADSLRGFQLPESDVNYGAPYQRTHSPETLAEEVRSSLTLRFARIAARHDVVWSAVEPYLPDGVRTHAAVIETRRAKSSVS